MSCRAASRVRILRDVPVTQAQTAEMSYAAKIVGRTSKVGLPYQELVLCKADEEYEFGDSSGLDFTICWDDDTKRWILTGHNEHLSFWVDRENYPPLSCCLLAPPFPRRILATRFDLSVAGEGFRPGAGSRQG